MSNTPPSLPPSSRFIHDLRDQCEHVHKRQKTHTHQLQQQVDTLIHRVNQFQQQLHQLDNNNNSSSSSSSDPTTSRTAVGVSTHGALFLKQQLPSFAMELKDLIQRVSQTHRDFHSEEVAPLVKTIEQHTEQNQELFYRHYAESHEIGRAHV